MINRWERGVGRGSKYFEEELEKAKRKDKNINKFLTNLKATVTFEKLISDGND